jgi:hypothetical protein
MGVGTTTDEIVSDGTLALAARKGFLLFRDQRSGEFRLIDVQSRLPQLNIRNGSVFFSQREVLDFLTHRHDRLPR